MMVITVCKHCGKTNGHSYGCPKSNQDLLEALKEMVEAFSDLGVGGEMDRDQRRSAQIAYDKAEHAIAKAENQP